MRGKIRIPGCKEGKTGVEWCDGRWAQRGTGGKGRRTRAGKPVPRRAGAAEFWGGAAVLGEAGVYQFWRADRADCDHAHGTRGETALDWGRAVFTCAKFLHATAGAGGAAVGDLLRVVVAPDVGRDCGGGAVRAAVGGDFVGAELCLCRVWQRGLDRGGVSRTQGGGAGGGGCGGAADWAEGA